MSELESLVNTFVAGLRAISYPALTGGALVPVEPEPVTYDSYTGWSLTGSSKYGAPRSAGVDALRQELLDGGYDKIASELPTYHCIAFWLRDQMPQTIRFSMVKAVKLLSDFGSFGLTMPDENENILVDNIVRCTESLFPFLLGGMLKDPINGIYRGRYGQHGFVKVVHNGNDVGVDFSPAMPPNYAALAAADTIKRPQSGFVESKRVYGLEGFKSEPIPGTESPDHYVYDMWWDGRTDDNVTTYWRNWAIAVGAKIDP